jgi:hypothetical protein
LALLSPAFEANPERGQLSQSNQAIDDLLADPNVSRDFVRGHHCRIVRLRGHRAELKAPKAARPAGSSKVKIDAFSSRLCATTRNSSTASSTPAQGRDESLEHGAR